MLKVHGMLDLLLAVEGKDNNHIEKRQSPSATSLCLALPVPFRPLYEPIRRRVRVRITHEKEKHRGPPSRDPSNPYSFAGAVQSFYVQEENDKTAEQTVEQWLQIVKASLLQMADFTPVKHERRENGWNVQMVLLLFSTPPPPRINRFKGL